MEFNQNSDSSEPFLPKIEIDSDPENSSFSRSGIWNQEKTAKLIEVWCKECPEHWDSRNPLNRDKKVKQAKQDYLACMFGTTSEEIARKLHNLRTQYNAELRKMRKKESQGEGVVNSSWEYFEALSFLQKEPTQDPLDIVDGVNITLAEFQANEEEEFGAIIQARLQATDVKELQPKKRAPRVAASAPPPLSANVHSLMCPEEAVPRIRPGHNVDECQVFGDFVASELRTLRSDESRKRLKRMIQKAILQIGEEEDSLKG